MEAQRPSARLVADKTGRPPLQTFRVLAAAPQEIRSSVRLAELADSIEDHIIVRDRHLMRPPRSC